MTLENAIDFALSGNAIVFLGSGFSIGATKKDKSHFTTASPLAHTLLKRCGIRPEEYIDDLSQAAEIFQMEKGNDALVSFMKNEYTANETNEAQKIISNIPWQRVYTTNYDNVFELAAIYNKKHIISATLSDSPYDFKNKDNLCIHLNGYIDTLTTDKLDSEFKLTNASYLTDTFIQSEWLSLFRTDLQTARAIFFIGYSMQYDLDIKRIVFSTNDIANKSFFILHPNESEINLKLIRKFGQTFPIGNDEFSKKILEEKKSLPSSTRLKLPPLCFRSPSVDSKPSKIQTSDEFRLILEGEYDTSKLFYSTVNPHDFQYCIRRTKLDSVIDAIKEGATNILIHSDLGNGKTIFIECLAEKLARMDYKVYIYSKSRATISREIEDICKCDEASIFIFEDYYSKLDFLKIFKQHRSGQILIVSERSAMNDLGYEDLTNVLGDFLNYDLNQLDEQEIEQIIELFNTHGLWTYLSSQMDYQKKAFIKKDCNCQIKNIILKVLESPTIINRFKDIITSLKKKEGFFEAILFILIAQVSNLDFDLEDLAYALDVSKLNSPKFKNDPIVKEFINFENSTIRSKSSLISRVLLQQVFDTTVVIDAMISIYTKLHNQSENYKVRGFLKKMMMFTNLQHCLNKKDTNYKYNVLRFYEELKTLSFCKKNPHFWLQYAIVMITGHDLDKAKIYFQTAYSYAKEIPSFNVYQIDNHYARYLLENEIESGVPETCMNAFDQAHTILMDPQHIHEVRHYPFRVAQNYLPFYDTFYKKIKPTEQKRFTKACQEILTRIEKYLRTASSKRYEVIKTQKYLNRILSQIITN